MRVLPRIFKLWPRVDLDSFYVMLKLGHKGFCMGKSENYLFFGTYCSLMSQSCLKHSAKWVNEVEWVSKVKVILWPWSKVTQISKLNVWVLACILRWAIQGLLALLFFYVRGFFEISSFETMRVRWSNNIFFLFFSVTVSATFLIIVLILCCFFVYFRKKGDYHTKEAKGQELADNPDAAIVFCQTGVPDIPKRQEWFM